MARPKQFDMEQALKKAMLTFWEKGYAATSVPDLLKRMGISRSSLYESFTDKHTLFVEALGYYERMGKRRITILERASSVKDGLREFFNHHITLALDEDSPGGCFITNTIVAAHHLDPAINQVIEDSYEQIENALRDLFKRGLETGEISPDRDIQSLVSLFHCINHGINIMVKVNKDRAAYEALVNEALELI
jgi:TetR/AcrR family transcriptional repressor of nem operon